MVKNDVYNVDNCEILKQLIIFYIVFGGKEFKKNHMLHTNSTLISRIWPLREKNQTWIGWSTKIFSMRDIDCTLKFTMKILCEMNSVVACYCKLNATFVMSISII